MRKETGFSENELFSTDRTQNPEVGERVRIRKFGKDWDRSLIEEFHGVLNYKVDFDYNKALHFKDPDRVVYVDFSDIVEYGQK